MARSHFKQDTRSYSQQFDDIKGHADLGIFDTAYPKPDKDANAKAKGAYKLPFSDIYAVPKERPLLAAGPATMSEEEATRRLRIIYAQRYFGLIGEHSSR